MKESKLQSFQVKSFIKNKNDKYYNINLNNSCFAGLKGHDEFLISTRLDKIDKKFANSLIKAINTITKCEFRKISLKDTLYESISKEIEDDDLFPGQIYNKQKYLKYIKSALKEKRFIYFKSLGTYVKDLLLLNFIRLIWHSGGYINDFDRELFKKRVIEMDHSKDCLKQLLTFNKECCLVRKNPNNNDYFIEDVGHSNTFRGDKVKLLRKYGIKTFKKIPDNYNMNEHLFYRKGCKNPYTNIKY